MRPQIRVFIPAMIFLAQIINSPYAKSAGEEGDLRAGKADWIGAGCYSCHGYAAQGAEDTGQQLTKHAWTFEVFSQIVRNPISVMPPFTKKLLSDDELRNIMAYVNSIHQHKKNKNENIGSGK